MTVTASRALALTASWPVDNVAAAVLRGGDVVATVGDTDRSIRIASLTKPVAAWAMLVAVEEGSIELDASLGQPGCTLRHLMAHAGGYPFQGHVAIAAPERTRTYSNGGIEVAADGVAAATGLSFTTYLSEAVLDPLGMTASTLSGSPAHGLNSTVSDFAAFVAEVMSPMLITAETRDEATRVHYPTLSGIVPGVGRYERCPWGLGFEIRGDKSPHWTGAHNAPSTFGHFGGAGTMFWIDPTVDLAVIALTDRRFDLWADDALRVWPELSDAVLAEFGGGTPAEPAAP